MSKHPTERIRSVQEIQAKASLDSDKALRRVALAEERLARVEGRLAERDELIAEFREAYGRQADTISALSAVVRELESKNGAGTSIAKYVSETLVPRIEALEGKMGRGVDQVLTGLEERIKELESKPGVKGTEDVLQNLAGRLLDLEYDRENELEERLKALESKPKRGRPKGSKNKPKTATSAEDLGYTVPKAPRSRPKDTPGVEDGNSEGEGFPRAENQSEVEKA